MAQVLEKPKRLFSIEYALISVNEERNELILTWFEYDIVSDPNLAQYLKTELQAVFLTVRIVPL